MQFCLTVVSGFEPITVCNKGFQMQNANRLFAGYSGSQRRERVVQMKIPIGLGML